MEARHTQAYHAIADMLQGAQGVRDAERHRLIDIRSEAILVRTVLDEYRTALAAATERTEAAEKERDAANARVEAAEARAAEAMQWRQRCDNALIQRDAAESKEEETRQLSLRILEIAGKSCTESKRRADVLAAGLHAVESLIADSRGVCGLHLNGEDAPWEDLRTGGQLEGWLLPFDAALDALAARLAEVDGEHPA